MTFISEQTNQNISKKFALIKNNVYICNHIEFVDSKEGNQFIARIPRPIINGETTKGMAVSNGQTAVSSEQTAVSSEQMAVSKTKKSKNIEYSLLQFCQTPRSMSEICEHFALKDRYKAKRKYINPLLGTWLQLTEPNSPNSPTQKYVTIKEKE